MTRSILHTEPVQDVWLDAYGHVNMGYFMVPFGNATWRLMDTLGIGVDYTDSTRCAFYTLESHLRYLKEVRAPACVDIEGMVLDFDRKRIHYAMVMSVAGVERATCEYVDLHVDLETSRSAEMSESVQAVLRRSRVSEIPSWFGQSVSLGHR